LSNLAESDLQRIAKLIAEVAQAEIVPRFRALAEGDWREKGPGDIVTIADERAEAALEPRLQELLPGSVVLGEEAAAKDKSLFGLLSGDRPVWIIDPIDGTANFAEGKIEFCSMLALVQADRLLASWIHEPLAGRTTCAVAGGGVQIIGPAREQAIDPAPQPETGAQLRGVMAVGHKGRADLVQRTTHLKSLLPIHQVRSLRCAGFDYLRLLAGELDFLLFSGVMPWDHAAGALLVREQGGLAGYLGDAGHYLASRSIVAEGVLATSRAADWQTIADHLGHGGASSPRPVTS
jgi:fructose-1,6-bisphosphatase/inositol monophosphatase family enzyme